VDRLWNRIIRGVITLEAAKEQLCIARIGFLLSMEGQQYDLSKDDLRETLQSWEIPCGIIIKGDTSKLHQSPRSTTFGVESKVILRQTAIPRQLLPNATVLN